MIEEGDHIAVGISGDKDSLTLLYALHGLRRFYPKRFTLSAITVHPGIEGFDLSPIQDLCDELDVPYYIVETDNNMEERKHILPCEGHEDALFLSLQKKRIAIRSVENLVK